MMAGFKRFRMGILGSSEEATGFSRKVLPIWDSSALKTKKILIRGAVTNKNNNFLEKLKVLGPSNNLRLLTHYLPYPRTETFLVQPIIYPYRCQRSR
jgi:hypothetical protein